jgi:heme o synthase
MRNQTNAASISLWRNISQAITDFGLLVKFRLTLLVLFSAVMSYIIVAGEQFSWSGVLLLGLGGFLVTGAANAFNQVLERDYDKLMQRTINRPVVTGRMSVSAALLLAGLMTLLGGALLAMFNPLTGVLGTLSLVSYAFIYTPLKRSTPLAVAVGAIPGALPNVIGCVAIEGYISTYAFMLFAIQFLWQFPHFWAVAWLADEDYKRAGFSLLPSRSGEKDSSVGMISMLFCVALVVTSLWAAWAGLVGFTATAALVSINLYWAWACWQLYRKNDRPEARRQMFVSFFHLPFTLIVLWLDKIF